MESEIQEAEEEFASADAAGTKKMTEAEEAGLPIVRYAPVEAARALAAETCLEAVKLRRTATAARKDAEFALTLRASANTKANSGRRNEALETEAEAAEAAADEKERDSHRHFEIYLATQDAMKTALKSGKKPEKARRLASDVFYTKMTQDLTPTAKHEAAEEARKNAYRHAFQYGATKKVAKKAGNKAFAQATRTRRRATRRVR